MAALQWGALTDVGRSRTGNEDSIVAQFPVFAVADGMGGHVAGEVASQVTVEHLAALGADGEPTGERLVSAMYPLHRYTEAIEHAASAGPRAGIKICFDLRNERERNR